MTKARKPGIKSKFRQIVNATAIKLKLRKVKVSEKSRSISPPKIDCDISAISEIDVQPVKKQDSPTPWSTKAECSSSTWSWRTDSEYHKNNDSENDNKLNGFIHREKSSSYHEIFDCESVEAESSLSSDDEVLWSTFSKGYHSKRSKRYPSAGSNFSKIPILSEIATALNPAGWVSSKTQKDTRPIKN